MTFCPRSPPGFVLDLAVDERNDIMNYRFKSFYGVALSALLGSSVFLGGCASKKSNKAEKIETQMEKSQSFGAGEEVGVKSGNLVVQRKVFLAEELRKLHNDVYSLEDEVYGNPRYQTLGLYGVYKECKAKLSDKRIGGTGKLNAIEPPERVTENEPEMRIGIDEKKQLVSVSEEGLQERITRFKGYKKVLDRRASEYREKTEICEQEYRTALIDNGLKPEDTKSQGEWVMGPQGYRVWRARTLPTQDPEELARRKAKGETKPVKDPVTDED